MVENYINLLKNKKSKLDDENLDFVAWKGSTLITLGRIYDENSQNIKQMDDIKYEVNRFPLSVTIGSVTGGNTYNNLQQCTDRARAVLGAIIDELENAGFPPIVEKNDRGTHINVTQNQTVSLNLIISSIKDELTEPQLKEIKSILKSTDDGEEKKNKITNKLRDFGTDVASKILANVLTNPSILDTILS